MQLEDVLHRIPLVEIVGKRTREVSEIGFDSRTVTRDSLYIAIRGTVSDGHQYIDAAIAGGAGVIVCEKLPASKKEEITYVVVKNTAVALGNIAKNFYDNPSSKLTLIGVTGTNGKTSTMTICYEVFTELGYKCALISTVENRIGDKVVPADHTTPDIISLNKLLSQAVYEDCEFVFMEVSSHGIHQHRTEGLQFKIAGFTNITHDHLDYHKTFAEYLRVKKSFFDHLPPDAVAITNADDKNGWVMLQNTTATKKTYALKTVADFQGKILESDFNGMLLKFNGTEFWTNFTGKFNAYNLLLVYGIASSLGVSSSEILRVLSLLDRVRGRFETLKSKTGIFFVVDYAHTPDALENVLQTINEIRTKNEKLICVFGCGGDRDHSKRPEMGDIATKNASLVIVTSDNPRTEDPLAIIKEIESGVQAQNYSKYISVPDRKEAIKTAIKLAEPGDIILVAGKGHETYQEINGVKSHFDDKETLQELLELMNK